MKNATATAALAFGLMMTSAAWAGTTKAVQSTKADVDLTTTQSIKMGQNCSAFGANLKHSTCGSATSYPDNALSGLNLGF